MRALVCRRCGKRQRVSPRVFYLGLAGLTLAAMFAVAGVGSLMPGARSNNYAAPAAAAGPGPAGIALAAIAAPPRGPVRLTAADLWAAYNKDAVAADHLYKDRPLVVTGRVLVAPVRDFRGSVVLRLGTGDTLEMVHATLVGHDTLIDALPSKGQVTTVSCTGRGAIIGAPLLGACKLVQ